jgi:hypothetical protein
MNRLTYALFAGIILLGIVLRLYRFDNPIADWHSWRQVDTSSVSRNFVNNGFDVLHPTFHDLSNVPSGKDNPNGYRFVEFPIYNLFQAGFYSLFGIFSLEEWGRIVTIVSSVLSITFIFLLLKKYTDSTAALSAAFLYAILPYNIYYGRVVLPDPTTSMTILGSIFFFDLWINNGKKIATIKSIVYFIFALIFTASALLLKPFALFFMLPMVAIAYNAFGLNMFKKGQLYIFAALSLAPLMGWRLWMTQFPEGIPASDWLLNGGNIRFKPSFFNWIFANRIGGLILGFWGAVFLVVGLVINSNSEKIYGFLKGQMLIFWAFLISSLAYLIVVARGNVQHDYYQILIIPTIVIFGGLGMKFFINPPKELINKNISRAVLLVCLILTFAFQWYQVRDFFNINRGSIIIAGQAIDRIVPKDAKVIANYEGDTTFLYQTKRSGWASYQKPLPEMVELGADYLVIADPKESDLNFGNDYKIIEQTQQYIIFDLRKSP